MDNTQDTNTSAPAQGQAAPVQVQVPNADTGGVSAPSGTDVGATQSSEQSVEAFQMPEKFSGKSAEDIAKSYVELESHNKKVEMERANLEKMFAAPSTTQSPNPTAAVQEPQGDTNDELKKLLTPVANELFSPVLAKLEVRDMVDRYGDNFSKLAPQVKAVKEANPTLSLEQAYKLAAFDSVGRTAKNEGVAQAAAVQQEQVKSQVESSRPSGVRPQSVEQAIGDKSVPTAEILVAMGPEYAGFAAKYASLASQKLPRH